MYWRIKEWFRSGGEIVYDKKLIDQLLSIRYREELSGKMKIMSKEDMKKEGYPSPDKADGLALTFYAIIKVDQTAIPKEKKLKDFDVYD